MHIGETTARRCPRNCDLCLHSSNHSFQNRWALADLNEWARRALLFSKTWGLLAIEILESVLQGCFGCDHHASRFRHQLRIRIQRSDSETRKLMCLRAFDSLDTPRYF